MAFAPNPHTITAGNTGNAKLTFTITNKAAIPLTNLAFDHTLPQAPSNGLQIDGGGGSITTPATCGAAALTALAGTDTIKFTGGQVAPGQTCIVTIPIKTAVPLTPKGDYDYLNSPVTLKSTEVDPVTAGPVTWTVKVN
jgi:hypothetical protein